jgi:probable F420-dependent oxidoreductase
MRVDVMAGGLSLRAVQDLARDTKAAGFDGLVITESGRTAYLACAAAALAQPDLDLATGVAVAFPRSPMITASTAWELAEATDGRFRLGLGTQVRAHIERRYGVDFDPPGPRLEDYVQAVKACFAAFRGGKLGFEGRFTKLSLLPPTWSPGAIPVPDPAVDIAAVGPWMLRMAGRVADGVHVHPLNTETYLRETVVPMVAAGQREAGRAAGSVQLLVPAFTVVGDTEDERARQRDLARSQVSFYGSTPNYAFIFEQIGFPDTTPKLRERQKAGDIAGMATVITDDILEHFVVSATWDGLADALVARYGGIAERVILYYGATMRQRSATDFARLGEVARAVTTSPGSR